MKVEESAAIACARIRRVCNPTPAAPARRPRSIAAKTSANVIPAATTHLLAQNSVSAHSISVGASPFQSTIASVAAFYRTDQNQERNRNEGERGQPPISR
jgi:hypothetical protein